MLNVRQTGQCSGILLTLSIRSHLLVYKLLLTSFILFKLLHIIQNYTNALCTVLLKTNKGKCEKLWETKSGIGIMLTHGHWSSVTDIGMWNHDLVKDNIQCGWKREQRYKTIEVQKLMMFGDKKKKSSQHMLVG